MLFACRIVRLNAPFSGLAAHCRVQPTATRQQQIGVRRLLLCPPPHSRGFSISQRLNIDQASAAPSLSGAPKTSFLRRALAVTAIGIFFTSAGFVMTTIPAFTTANELLHPPSDEETLRMYIPGDDFARDVDDYIRNHPLAVELRSKPEYSESRPHLKVPPSARSHSLTSGTLMGPGKVIVPPYAWSERGGKSLVTISYLGTDMCGHAGIVHGGLLATILDESLARCCFAALPNKIGMTANLNINYRAPVPAGSYIVLRAKTTKVEGRKAWVEGRLESLVADGETPIIYADASALFIEPRQAASMAKIYPVQ